MNVLIISPNSSFGGAATANFNIARMLNMFGCNVVYNDEFLTEHIIAPFEISTFQVYGNRKEKNSLYNYVIKEGFDYVILGDNRIAIHNCFQLYKLRRSGVKIGMLFHSLSISSNLRSRITDILVSFSTLFVDHLIFVSKYTKDSWSRFIVPRQSVYKHIIMYNAVSDAQPTACLRTKPVILFVGRFSPEKRPDLFCQIAKIMHDKFDFIMWGDGSMYEDLTKEYVSYVTFKGYSNNVEEIYKDGSLLVVPSVFENCPMCILEAMVRGIPSICTRVGGIPEIVEEGKNGEFIDIHDPFSSFAAMSAKILSNYDYYSNACVSASKSHTLDFQSKMWKVFFNSI